MFFHPVVATQIFANSRYPDGYRPASRAYFQSQILPPVCFIIPNPAPQITLILRSRKTYWDPQDKAGNPEGYLWRPASRAYFQYGISPPVCFIIPNPRALTICTEISVKNFRQMVLVFLLAPKTGTGLSCTIYKIPVKFSLSLDMKPGTGHPNKWC